MQITYDKQGDVMYIQLRADPAFASPVNDFMNVYFTEDDQIAGIELFDVSKYADHIDQIAQEYDIKKLPQKE